jgi:O-antigen ligase
VVSPHNFYLQTFLNIGGAGLLVLLMIYIGTLRSLMKQKQSTQYVAYTLIIISQLLYFMTWNSSYEQGILLGSAIMLANSNVKDMKKT